MAASIPSRAILLACVLAAAANAAAPPAIAKFDSTLPISLEAQSTEFDFRNSSLVFRKVKISQGTMSVEADQAQATGLNFDNSRWDFHGQVHMTVEQGFLTSEDAQISFANKILSKAVINGNPAEFEQRSSKTGQLARGRAQLIEYDVKQGTVKLSKDAWLTDGQNEIRGQTLKYSIRDQRVVADASEQGSERVHITITPPPKTKP